MGESKQIVVPDSPEARTLALLGGFAADLIEVADAFAIAESFSDAKQEPGATIYRFLVAHGVVAYARCFADSNVRARLGTFVSVPPEFADTHDALMKLRNRTIAHSESNLQPSFAVVDLSHDGTTVVVDRALSITITTGMPRPIVQKARLLVTELQASLQSEFDAAKTAVAVSIDVASANSLWTTGERLRLTPTDFTEWTPDTRRPKYPKSHEVPIYMDVDPDAQTGVDNDRADEGGQSGRNE